MATYYGIEQSTDSREPRTGVARLGHGKRGRARAEEYAATPTRLTYADPEAARNFHHTLYSAYEMPAGWHPPTRRQLAAEARRQSTRDYPRSTADVLARLVRRDGVEVVPTSEPSR